MNRIKEADDKELAEFRQAVRSSTMKTISSASGNHTSVTQSSTTVPSENKKRGPPQIGMYLRNSSPCTSFCIHL